MTYQLSELAKQVKGEVSGSGQVEISGVGSLQNARSGQITFLGSSHYKHLLNSTDASAVILRPGDQSDCSLPVLLCDNPRLAFVHICELFPVAPKPQAGVHKSADLGKDCVVGEGISIGPGVAIGANTVIGENCVIGPNCTIGPDCIVGDGCQLTANVVLMYNTRLGTNVILHPGAIIGADGFGLVFDEDGNWVKIPQRGGVVLGDNVEIGANTTVDRGALEDTVIENDVRIDNQVQIAHNVRIGEHTAIAGCVGIAGSATVGKRCKISGGVKINGHINICDDVTIMTMSEVTKPMTRPGLHAPNNPILISRGYDKISARLSRLSELFHKPLKKGT